MAAEESKKAAESVPAAKREEKAATADLPEKEEEALPASVTNVARKRESAKKETAADTAKKETAAEAAKPEKAANAAKKDAADTAGKETAVSENRRTGSRRAAGERGAGSRTAGERSANTRTAGERSASIQIWISEMPEGNTKRYLQDRVVPQMKWYSEKSAHCKKWYIRLTAAAIVVGALIPVASVYSEGGAFMKAFIALLGSAVTAINAFLALFNYRDLWNAYRKTREDLLQTLYYYFNNTGLFDDEEEQEKKDRRLIKICEERMEQEHGGWSALLEK